MSCIFVYTVFSKLWSYYKEPKGFQEPWIENTTLQFRPVNETFLSNIKLASLRSAVPTKEFLEADTS